MGTTHWQLASIIFSTEKSQFACTEAVHHKCNMKKTCSGPPFETIFLRKQLTTFSRLLFSQKTQPQMFQRVLNTPLGAFLKHFTKFTRLLNYCQAKACNFLKKETLTHVFSCEFCEISENSFCYRTSPVDAFDFTKVLRHLFTDLSRLLLYIVNMIIPNIKTHLNNVK